MTHVLQNLVLFFDHQEKQNLYWRCQVGRIRFKQKSLHLDPGAAISFDTFFNAFFPKKWYANTVLDSLSATLSLSGDAVVSLKHHTGNHDSVIETRTIVGDGPHKVTFIPQQRLTQGFLYLTVRARGAVELWEGGFLQV